MDFRLFVILGFLFVSACGGGADPVEDPDPVPDPDPLTYSELSTLLTTLNDDDRNFAALDPADVPDSGSATYAGVATIFETNATNDRVFLAIGEMNIEVAFGSTPTLDGTADNFYEAADPTAAFPDTTGTEIDGSLTLGATGDLDGTLTKIGGEVATYDLDSSGIFYKDTDARLLSGIAGGTSSATGRSDIDATGVYLTEKE